jgi:3-hydroxyisobutyrate dehydrogenase
MNDVTQPQAQSIGFLGLGNMGAPMARRLVEAGHDVVGFDTQPGARDRLKEQGGRVGEDATALAGQRVIILMLPTSDVVESVLITGGLAAALAPGTLVIDMSSSEPMRTRALAEKLAVDGIRLIDAPVSGGVKGAELGTLTIMAGGSEADIAEGRAVLDTLGSVRRVGDVGAGDALKALNNLLSATHLWATSEAVLVGERFGLDPAVMIEAINGSSGRSGSTDNKWPNFILTERYDSGFGLQLMAKDMRIARSLAQQLGVPFTLGDEATALWSSIAEKAAPGADHTEVARLLRDGSAGPVTP